MPFLIALMAFRHSLQLYNRYYEEYLKKGDSVSACNVIIERMFLAGLTSIVTDAFGIAIIAIVPIALLQNISIVCAFSSIVTVIIGLILTPILLSYVPISSKFIMHMEKERQRDRERKGLANHFADWLGPWLIARHGRYTVFAVVLVILGFSYYWSERIIIGDAHVGSNLLWPNSRYNLDAGEINRNLPLINPLYIVAAGEDRNAIKDVQVLKDIDKFSLYMAMKSGAAGTQTIIGPIKAMGQKLHEDDPKWMGFPDTREEVETFFSMITTSGDPGDMDKFIDYHDKFTNIVVFFMDKTGPTIKNAISIAKEYIETKADPGEGVKYKLAAGVIGIEAAINEVVTEKQVQTLVLALLGVFIFCSVHFRSFKAGLILMIPLCISNIMAFAYMAINQIGLSLSTLPVSAAGIGMGVDYGIYLLARLEEEKRKNSSISLEMALNRTIQTYGKSIIYIAGTLVIGLLMWVISGLRFQAEMGLMLAIILFLNCLGAVFLVPVLVLLFKPRFPKGAIYNK